VRVRDRTAVVATGYEPKQRGAGGRSGRESGTRACASAAAGAGRLRSVAAGDGERADARRRGAARLQGRERGLGGAGGGRRPLDDCRRSGEHRLCAGPRVCELEQHGRADRCGEGGAPWRDRGSGARQAGVRTAVPGAVGRAPALGGERGAGRRVRPLELAGEALPEHGAGQRGRPVGCVHTAVAGERRVVRSVQGPCRPRVRSARARQGQAVCGAVCSPFAVEAVCPLQPGRAGAEGQRQAEGRRQDRLGRDRGVRQQPRAERAAAERR